MTEIQQKRTLGLAITSLVFGCLFLFPLLGILFSLTAVILGIIALVKISKNKDTLKGEGLAIAGIVLGGVGIVLIPIIALLAAIAIPNLLRARLNANEAKAESTVKSITMAIENHAFSHEGRYPSDESEIMGSTSSYTDRYDNSTALGYRYSLDLSPEGYRVTATPVTCGATGTRIFTGETSGQFSEQECR